MPRSGRGGRRTGKIGGQYANRADLRDPKLPVTTVPGGEYGSATAQANAQRAVPMAGAPVIAPGAASPVMAPGSNQAAAPPPVTGLPPGLPPPGSMPPLDAPTNRPDENLMTGVPAGPGPGLEALSPVIIHPLVQAAGALNALGDAASPQVKTIRDVLNAQLSNQGTP